MGDVTHKTTELGEKIDAPRGSNEEEQRQAPGAHAQLLDLSPLATLLERIKERYRPIEVWLFGSRARGDARDSSDWDLLVAVPDDADEEELSPLEAWRLQRGSGVYADVIPCRASELRADRDTANTLAYVVAREGVLLYER